MNNFRNILVVHIKGSIKVQKYWRHQSCRHLSSNADPKSLNDPQNAGPKAIYDARVEQGKFSHDPHQAKIVERLQGLYHEVGVSKICIYVY